MSDGKENVSQLPVPAEAPHSSGVSINLAGVSFPLRRTFAAIDRLIALPLEALASVVESKFQHNLGAHVEAVQTRRTKKGKQSKIENPSVKTTKALADWAVAAGTVEDGDKELSALWRTILDKIMENEDEGGDLLRAVQGLSNADLRYFLKRYGGMDGLVGYITLETPDGVHGRLHNAALVSRPINPPYLFAGTGFGIVGLGLFRPLLAGLLNSLPAFSLPTPGVVSVTITAGVLCLSLYLVRYIPTSAGNRLRDLYREYRRL